VAAPNAPDSPLLSSERINPRILLLFIVTALLVANALIASEVWRRWHHDRDQGRITVEIQNEIFSAYILHAMEKYRLLLDVVSARIENGDGQGLDGELVRIKSSDRNVMDILVLSKEGHILSWSGQGTPPRVSDREYYRALKDDPARTQHVSAPALSRVHKGKTFFSLSLALRGKSGALEHAVVVIIDLAEFMDDLEGLAKQEGMSVALHLFDGTTLFRLPRTNAPLGLKAPGIASFQGRVPERYFRILPSPYDHKMRYVSGRSIETFGLVSVCSLAEEQVFREWRAYAVNALLLGAVISTLLGVLGWFLWRQARRNSLFVEHLQQMQAELHQLSIMDPLTDTHNRRLFDSVAAAEVERAIRYKTSLALLMMDLDHFKLVNDRYGHAVGDQVLRLFADLVKPTIRDGDFFARIGGEEFALLLPHADREGARESAERLRQCVEQTPLILPGGMAIPVTVSIGIAQLAPDDREFASLMQKADRALYRAKEMGRNRVVVDATEYRYETEPDA
jgi:diguanylate cyclase (GGDEF)-like protein